MNRRQFVRNFVGMTAFANCICAEAATMSLCTPAPEFRVPLTQGVWRSQEFRVNKRYYNMWLWLKMDGRMPLEELECHLGRPRGHSCETSPLLDLEWKIWDRGTLVNSWAEKTITVATWGPEVRCLLGGFHGKRNGHFTLEWNVKKDAGVLKDLHSRIEIVRYPIGWWCSA